MCGDDAYQAHEQENSPAPVRMFPVLLNHAVNAHIMAVPLVLLGKVLAGAYGSHGIMGENRGYYCRACQRGIRSMEQTCGRAEARKFVNGAEGQSQDQTGQRNLKHNQQRHCVAQQRHCVDCRRLPATP